MRRRYHVIERAVTCKKEIDKAPGKDLLPAIPSPPFAECQHRCAKSIIRESRYDAQQILHEQPHCCGDFVIASICICRTALPPECGLDRPLLH